MGGLLDRLRGRDGMNPTRIRLVWNTYILSHSDYFLKVPTSSHFLRVSSLRQVLRNVCARDAGIKDILQSRNKVSFLSLSLSSTVSSSLTAHRICSWRRLRSSPSLSHYSLFLQWNHHCQTLTSFFQSNPSICFPNISTCFSLISILGELCSLPGGSLI